MKKSMLFIFLVSLVIISGCIQNQQSSKEIFPSDFTVEITNDQTSSGATRLYTLTLTFKNNELIEGNEIYHFSDSYRINDYGCKYNKESGWVDEQGRQCKYESFMYYITNKGQLDEGVTEGRLKEKGQQECQKFEFCYAITK